MPCNCGKNKGTVHFMGQGNSNIADPLKWGPILWKYLHGLAEKIGMTSNIIDVDQANYIETIITTLHLIIPCTDCQAHTASYISSNPFPSLKGLHGEQLRSILRNWLFDFHNAVRISKGQPILLNLPGDCITQYAGFVLPKSDYMFFIQSVAFAVRQGWVRIDNWRKWYSNSERLRLITNIIV